jgi:hypothetical protein
MANPKSAKTLSSINVSALKAVTSTNFGEIAANRLTRQER